MPVILEKLIKALENIETRARTGKNFADKWLGAFEGVIPEGMTRTEYIKKLRESCYGKTQDISGF
ncbi:MAG: hypothetical protein WAW23_10430 [Candidatus Methanoperedens sp.]